MVVGEVATACDVAVVGGGPGGYVAALRAAQAGMDVVLVERDRLGGVCLNVGCIPSKALIHVAQLAHAAHEGAKWGVTGTLRVDLATANEAIAGVVGRLTGGVARLLEAAGVRVVAGTARLSNPHRLAVDRGDSAEHVQFDHLILAPGSRAVALPGLPFDGEAVVDSTGALAWREVPASLAVVGGGYVGVELGTAFAKLGARVSIVELEDRLLPHLPAPLGAPVAKRLGELGVAVHLGTKASRLEGAELVVETSQGERRVPADRVVVAVGRRPNTEDLGLEVVGVEPRPDGLLGVGPDRRTDAARHVLAIGDVTEGPALAHKAMAEAGVAARVVAGRRAAFDPRAIPAVVFSDPEVVTVGLGAEEARAAGIAAKAFRFPLSASGRAMTAGDAAGHAELVVDAADGTIIGGHLVGLGVSELAGEVALAVEMGATAEDLSLTVHPHPTVSEALAEAAHGLSGWALHVAGGSVPAVR